MADKNLVLEYSSMCLPFSGGTKISMYEDGEVEVTDLGFFAKGETPKKTNISAEQVRSFADRLVKSNFFSYQPRSSCAFDGLNEEMTLNYQGKSRTINSRNQTHQTLFPEIVKELEALVE